jgi:hypothetical protein
METFLMSTILTGLYTSPSAASSAVRTLEARGIPTADISVVAAEGTRREAFGIEGKTKAAEGAAVGAGLGGAMGAIIAGFTMVGALATGGVGLLAAGPIVAALAGAGAGATAGGAVGTLVGLAVPQNEIKFYDDALRKGSVLVGVNCDDSDRKAVVTEIFKTTGASKVSHA